MGVNTLCIPLQSATVSQPPLVSGSFVVQSSSQGLVSGAILCLAPCDGVPSPLVPILGISSARCCNLLSVLSTHLLQSVTSLALGVAASSLWLGPAARSLSSSPSVEITVLLDQLSS